MQDGGRPRSIKNDGRIKSLASNRPPSFGDRDLLINTDDLTTLKNYITTNLLYKYIK